MGSGRLALSLFFVGAHCSHIYSNSCTNVSLSSASNPGCPGYLMVRGFYRDATGCSDGSGCRSSFRYMTCCACDSCQSTADASNLQLPSDSKFWDSNSATRSCNNAYFFDTLSVDTSKSDMTGWRSVNCTRAPNVGGYLNGSFNVAPPANFASSGGALMCPRGAFVSGLYKFTNGGNKKDATDFGLICSFPDDQQCALISPPVNAMVTISYQNVSGDTCKHQGCVATQVCKLGYKPANTTSPNMTCDVSGNFLGTQLYCTDMNECNRSCTVSETPGVQECHNCDSHAQCSNNAGSFTCACKAGWAGSGTNCTNVNECSRRCSTSNPLDTPETGQCNNCTSNQTCSDTTGWFNCSCASGYQSFPACTDVNECAVNCTTAGQLQCNRCATIASCANTIGSYTCTCPSGYTDVYGNGTSCADINECDQACGPGVVTNCHNCQGLFQCNNTVGSFVCVCKSGYALNGSVCTNINECSSSNNCTSSPCIDTDGAYFCSPYVTFASIGATALSNTSYTVPGGTWQLTPDVAFISLRGIGGAVVWDNVTRYGSDSFPVRYQASNCTQVFFAGGVNVTCRLVPGSGARLAFAFQYTVAGYGQQTYRVTDKLFSYPAPQFTSGTLRQNGAATNNLTVQSAFGQSPLVQMNGTNFPAAVADATVLYGPKQYICAVEAISASQLSCRLAAGALGSDMTFSLIVGSGANLQVANGTDKLTTILIGPLITNLTSSNCTQVSPLVVGDCPTNGGYSLTLTSDQVLVNPIVMLISGFSCTNPTILANNVSFTCVMPPGTGVALPTAFAYASPPQFSSILQLVSYALPVITAVSATACAQLSSLALGSCSVAGNGVLTILGRNFGASGAGVRIGTVLLDALHTPGSEHTSLSVALPSYSAAGWVISNTIVVVQDGGLGSNQLVTLAFAPLCTAGQYEINGTCINCGNGTYGVGVGKCSLDCLPCPIGFYQPSAGASECLQCPVGTFQPLQGASGCLNCPPGSFSINTGVDNCAICPVGRFSTAGSSSCTVCPLGKYQPSRNQFSCLDCMPGQYTDASEQVSCLACPTGHSSALGASACFACAAGRFNVDTGSSGCNLCPVGTYAAQDGWAVNCLLCSPGRYQSGTGASSCVECDVGFEQPLPGQAVCTACNPGTYSVSSAQSSCSPCSPGSYTDVSGSTTCVDCSIGYYQSNAGAPNCTKCPIGQWNRNYRSSRCLACSAGSFQDETAKTSCKPCVAGQYSTSEQVSSCLYCTAGYAQPAQGQTFCPSCPPGRFSNSSGSSACLLCDPGFYGVSGGTTVCSACQPGTYQDLPGQTACTVCAVGQSSNSSGSSTCTDCPIGKYQPNIAAPITCTDCPIGNASGVSGATSCEFCNVGKFSDGVGATVCKDCVLGWVWDSNSVPPCRPCVAGTFSDALGLNCTSCAAGKYSSVASTPCLDCPPGFVGSSTGATICTACAPGKFAQAGQTACVSCPPTQYSPFPNSSYCQSCPSDISIVDKQNTTCLCSAGYYSEMDATGRYHCNKCIEGMECLSQGVTVGNLRTATGYWRINDTFTFILCPRQQYCLGGSAFQNDCQPHRRGILCGLCEVGYQANGASGVCELCPEASNSYVYSTFLILLMVLLLIAMFYIVLRFSNMQQYRIREQLAQMEKADRENLEATLAKYNSQDVGNAATDNLEGDDTVPTGAGFYELSTTEQKRAFRAQQGEIARENGEKVNSDAFFDAAFAEQKNASRQLPGEMLLIKGRTSPNFMYKVKILVGFFQIATILPFQGGIRWPSAFADFISIFSFLNFDFMPWQSIGCVASINYYQKAIIVGCTPIAILLLLLAFFYLPLWIHNTVDTLQEQLAKQQRQNHLNRKFVKLTLFTVFLLYPFVSKTVLGVFNCIEVDGTSYLLADLSLICFDDNWNSYAVACGFFVAMYPFGIPISYLLLLRKANLRDPATTYMLGFLYEAYVARCFYWEVVDMLHKLILTGIVAFAPANTQLVTNMAILILYLEVLLWVQPYLRKGDDRFHLLVQTELYLLALVGWILTPPNAAELTPDTDVLISLLLIGLTVFLMSSFMVIAGRNAYKLCKQFRKRRLEAQQAAIPPG